MGNKGYVIKTSPNNSSFFLCWKRTEIYTIACFLFFNNSSKDKLLDLPSLCKVNSPYLTICCTFVGKFTPKLI